MQTLWLDNDLQERERDRERIIVSDDDASAIAAMGRDLQARVTVTNMWNGERIELARQRCGLGCLCAIRRGNAPLFGAEESEAKLLRVALEDPEGVRRWVAPIVFTTINLALVDVRPMTAQR